MKRYIQYLDGETRSNKVISADLALYQLAPNEILIEFSEDKGKNPEDYLRSGNTITKSPVPPPVAPARPNIDGFFNDLDADPLFDSVAGNKVYMDLLGVAQSVAQQIAAGNVQRVQKRFALLASQLPTDMAAAIQQHANNNGIPL